MMLLNDMILKAMKEKDMSRRSHQNKKPLAERKTALLKAFLMLLLSLFCYLKITLEIPFSQKNRTQNRTRFLKTGHKKRAGQKNPEKIPALRPLVVEG